MDISIKDECFIECITELERMFKQHYDELIEDKENFPYGPNYRSFIENEMAGNLLFIAIRDGKKLIGYITNLIAPSFEFKEVVTCITQFLYLLPDYRKKGIGWEAMMFLEEKLKDLKVKQWVAGFRVNNDMSEFYNNLGFKQSEIVMTKLVGV